MYKHIYIYMLSVYCKLTYTICNVSCVMLIYIYKYIHVYIYIYIYIHIYIYTSLSLSLSLSVYIYIHIYTHHSQVLGHSHLEIGFRGCCRGARCAHTPHMFSASVEGVSIGVLLPNTCTPGLRFKIPVFSDPDPGKS